MREGRRGALGRIFGWCKEYAYKPHCSIDTLAESKDVIVIEAEVEHQTCCMKQHEHTEECGWDTIITVPTQTFFGDYNRQIGYRGRHGTPGPYLIFGVPKPKENRKP